MKKIASELSNKRLRKGKSLIVESTCFQRKGILKGTWRSPDGKIINQIDHIAIERPEGKCITNIRTYRGLDADTDYFMVGAQLVQLLSEARNQATEKTRNNRIARLRTKEEKVQYERNLRGELEAIRTEEARDKFEEQRTKAKMMLRNKKRKHYEKVLLDQIEENYRNNHIRNLYQGVKKERIGYQPKPVFYKDKDGKIIAGDDEVLERWKEYFKQ
ncbi:hypothetical protein NQ315_013707 [Exocentrus adspersus]|uniref:Uncharacterized protein n=1 Tax=Exocentrus adspersus TaxID=1586481 RepID=A0AAV8W3V2_9CUCU|nr:hypothetical protein NQ315_013707 [Exocentrus adspersus]